MFWCYQVASESEEEETEEEENEEEEEEVENKDVLRVVETDRHGIILPNGHFAVLSLGEYVVGSLKNVGSLKKKQIMHGILFIFDPSCQNCQTHT